MGEGWKVPIGLFFFYEIHTVSVEGIASIMNYSRHLLDVLIVPDPVLKVLKKGYSLQMVKNDFCYGGD